MNMGSSSVENCSQNETLEENKYQDLRLKRPDFYPCPDCGRKFTLRAMQIHQRSCFETEDCVCLVCKTGVKKKKLEIKRENFGTVPLAGLAFNDASDGIKDLAIKPKLRDLLTTKTKNGRISEAKNKLITFTLLDENCCAIEKIVAESKVVSKCNTSFNRSGEYLPLDRKYISMPSESSENLSPLMETTDGSPNKSSPSSKQNDHNEEHDGEPCNRKLFCCVCNEHIFWESFGLHVMQHCKTLDNNYLKCPECSKSYSKPALFLIHFFMHISSHPIDCNDCHCGNPQCIDAPTCNSGEHCYAENQNPVLPYQCYICLSRFSHGQTIVNHMRLHSKEMPFTCTECNRSFRQIGNLQRHMTTHRGDRPHKCPNCVRSFADPATLRNHVRVHTGETPFVCSICNRGFTQVGNLKRHMALHLQKDAASTSVSSTVDMVPDENTVLTTNTSEDIKVDTNTSNESSETYNPFEEIIPNSSNLSSTSTEPPEVNAGNKERKFSPYNIRKNRKEKMKVFTCNICKKVYTWQHDLAIHFRTHTGEKPYKCEICDKRFAQSGAVRIHKIRHHTNSAIGRSRWKNKL